MKRNNVPKCDRWNIEALYPSQKAWEADYKKSQNWNRLLALQGKLRSAPKIKTALDLYFSYERRLTKLYTWARLNHDVDLADNTHKALFDRISTLFHHFGEKSAWLRPELIAMNPALLKSPLLKEYRFFLESLLRLKSHTLSPAEERILALSGQALETPHHSFSALSDADFRFGKVVDSAGCEHELTHASYNLLIRSRDRTLRENTYRALLGTYARYENTFGEILRGEIQCHLFGARARVYSSCLEAALYPKNIDTRVYHSLIKAVEERADALHNYIKLRKKALGLEKLRPWDLYVPIVDSCEMKFSYREAEDIVIDAVAPLGSDYQDLLAKGLRQERWADRYENLNKRSGAYSGGCYDSLPYMLMNFKGTLRDLFTLAHEAGHSMHSLFSREAQPYHTADYEIFIAEIASTFHEELLTRYLLKRAKSRKERSFLINEKLEDMRATFFRQVMFAEFELWIHEMAEKNLPLTPASIKEAYTSLNARYFGSGLTLDPLLAIEWARIPHFYYNFYVYQYATGISAAIAFSEKVLEGGKKERERYLELLKSGSCDYPLALLKKAGLDMTSREPIETAINRFSSYTSELASLL
jgi:oligoendopeptidase F